MERFKFQIGWFFAVPLAYEIEQEAPIAVTKPEEVTSGWAPKSAAHLCQDRFRHRATRRARRYVEMLIAHSKFLRVLESLGVPRGNEASRYGRLSGCKRENRSWRAAN
jgi:hypothetical protein